MFKYIFYFFYIISTTQGAFIPYNKFIPINTNTNICPKYLIPYTYNLNQEQGEFIIKKISSIFPQVDSISHIVLHNSDILINCILNNNHISIDIKKNIVLFIVHFIQFGDASGGIILNFYNDLINCLL
jgi:hypothetical protein